MTKYLISFLSIFIIGCTASKKDTYTYLGGKIINPKKNYILLLDNEKVIDSILLNKNNTFTGTIKNLKEGLYYFVHGQELQFVYLEPKDSLLLRLNTWDFDESLVFSGKNAARNNLLIDAFLTEEKQRNKFYEYHKLSSFDFKKKADSILNIKKIQLENYIQLNDEKSKNFIEIAKIALNYPIYTEIESYIIGNSIKDKSEKLSSSFLKHRENTDLNKDSLLFYTPYNSYVFESIYSDVYNQRIKRNSDDFTIALINNIDQRISSKKLKNKTLKNSLIRHFLNKSSCDLSDKVFDSYYKTATNPKDIREIKALVADAKKVKTITSINDFSLYDYKANKYSIKQLIKNKNAVIYFRNKKYSSNEWVTSKINTLKEENPNTLFLVVDMTKSKIKNNKLIYKNQFYLTEASKANLFLKSGFPRAMLVDDKGVIKNGFASLSSPKIYKQISNLEK